MRNWILAVMLHGSVAGLFVLFLLWNAGKFGKGNAVSAVVPVGSHSSGVLPMVPVLRPADPTQALLFNDLQAGRAVCDGGYYARAAQDESGRAYTVAIRVDDKLIPCP